MKKSLRFLLTGIALIAPVTSLVACEKAKDLTDKFIAELITHDVAKDILESTSTIIYSKEYSSQKMTTLGILDFLTDKENITGWNYLTTSKKNEIGNYNQSVKYTFGQLSNNKNINDSNLSSPSSSIINKIEDLVLKNYGKVKSFEDDTFLTISYRHISSSASVLADLPKLKEEKDIVVTNFKKEDSGVKKLFDTFDKVKLDRKIQDNVLNSINQTFVNQNLKSSKKYIDIVNIVWLQTIIPLYNVLKESLGNVKGDDLSALFESLDALVPSFMDKIFANYQVNVDQKIKDTCSSIILLQIETIK
jgi:hypothetical protein